MQRPGEVASALFWRATHTALPLPGPIVVEPTDCVIVSRDGTILGVVPPGTYALDAATFPFLTGAATIDLCFVRTSPLRGVPVAGPLGTVYDPNGGMQVSPRLTGECTLIVADPLALVRGSQGMASVDAVLGWVNAIVLRQAAVLFARLVQEHKSALSLMVVPQLTQEPPATLGELQAIGVSVQLGNCSITLPDAERAAYQAAVAGRATQARDAMVARMQTADEGASQGGAPAAAVVAPPVVPPATPAARGGKAMLVVGLVGVVIVVGGGLAIAAHVMHGGASHESPPAAPAKRGKH